MSFVTVTTQPEAGQTRDMSSPFYQTQTINMRQAMYPIMTLYKNIYLRKPAYRVDSVQV